MCYNVVMRLHGVEIDERRVVAACRRAGVVRAYLFGSILSDRFTSTSDVDVLVETDPSRPVGMLALGGLQMDLSEVFGREVHLTLLGALPAGARQVVLAEARLLDAA